MLGIHIVTDGVVHFEDDEVGGSHRIGNIHTPGGVAAPVIAYLLTVPVNGGSMVGAVNFQEVTLSFRQVDFVDGLGIIALTPVVVTAAVLAVDGIPGMGQMHPMPVAGHGSGNSGCFLGKCPFGVQIYNLTHRNGPFCFGFTAFRFCSVFIIPLAQR